MIVTELFEIGAGHDANTLVGRVTLTPNRSLTWVAAKFFLATLFCLSFTIALTFLFLGYWVILFFTGIEMSVLAICFFYIARRTHSQEVLSMSGQSIILERGHKTAEVRHEWQRFFTKIEIMRNDRLRGRHQIVLRHQDQREEIGSFLNEEDKRDLIDALQELVRRANRPHLYVAL